MDEKLTRKGVMMSYDRAADLKIPDPPRGIKAVPWRLPIWLYKLKLGWLLGNRFILLTHIGRISGVPRQAVLEVIKYDQENRWYYSASGFGEKSQWFQNILKNPHVSIQSGRQGFPATAERLPVDEAEKIFLAYHEKYPNALKGLSKMVGYQLGETEDELRNFMRMLPVVVFKPEPG